MLPSPRFVHYYKFSFSLPSQPFITTAFLWAAHFFYSWAVLDKISLLFVLHTMKLVDNMLVVICLILYREQCEEF